MGVAFYITYSQCFEKVYISFTLHGICFSGTEAKSSAGWADFSAFQPAAVPETSNTSENQSKLEDSSNQTSEVTANSTS